MIPTSASSKTRRFLIATATLLASSTALAQDPPPAEAPPAAAPAPAEAAPAEPAPAAEAPAAEAPPAEAPPAEAAVDMPPAADAKPKPPPYSLPWQLRPVVPATVLRSDTAFAFFNHGVSEEPGSTIVSTLLASYKIGESFAPLVRLAVVSHNFPDAPPPPADSAFNFANPVVGGTYGLKLSPELRLAFFLGLTIPVGSGGGEPAAGNMMTGVVANKHAAANSWAMKARSAMDNAMFAVNDFTIFPGVGFAFLKSGFTAQVEVTLLQLMRVKGENLANSDESKTNFTTGLHLGYFFIPQLSLGAEIRHQRWLSTPKAIEVPQSPTQPYSESEMRDTTTFAVGPRVHIKVGEKSWFRPGIAYAMAVDNPMKNEKYKIVQLDLPFVF